MIRQLYFLLLCSIFSLKSSTETANILAESVIIQASVRCTNFRLPIIKSVHISSNATLLALRLKLATILQNHAGCAHCDGITHCPKATFKHAVNMMGMPVIIESNHEIWHDNDTVAEALLRNNKTVDDVIDFVLNEPKI